MRSFIFLFLFTQNVVAAHLPEPLPVMEMPDCFFLNQQTELKEHEDLPLPLLTETSKIPPAAKLIVPKPPARVKNTKRKLKEKNYTFRCREGKCKKAFRTYLSLLCHCSNVHKNTKLIAAQYCLIDRRSFSYKSLEHQGRCEEIINELNKKNARDLETKQRKKEKQNEKNC